jgi:hypothetical protein
MKNTRKKAAKTSIKNDYKITEREHWRKQVKQLYEKR